MREVLIHKPDNWKKITINIILSLKTIYPTYLYHQLRLIEEKLLDEKGQNLRITANIQAIINELDILINEITSYENLINLDYMKLILNFISPEYIQFDLNNLTDEKPINKFIETLNCFNINDYVVITEFFRHTITKNFPLNDKMLISHDFITEIKNQIPINQFSKELCKYLLAILATLRDLNLNPDIFHDGFTVHLFTRKASENLINYMCFYRRCEISMLRFATNNGLSHIAPFESITSTTPIYPLSFDQSQQFNHLLFINDKLKMNNNFNSSSRESHYPYFAEIPDIIKKLNIVKDHLLWQVYTSIISIPEFSHIYNVYDNFKAIYMLENAHSSLQRLSNHRSIIWNQNLNVNQQQNSNDLSQRFGCLKL